VSAKRAAFLLKVLEQMGQPYLWGAKGKPVGEGQRAFDCSGLVTWCLQEVGGPDWRAMYNTDRLWDLCTPTDTPIAGTLVLYGLRNDPSHVMIHVGAGVVIGASGGSSLTTSLEIAAAHGAKVKAFGRIAYRPDVLGYRELPLAG
jgi:murein DD-endopeptidase